MNGLDWVIVPLADTHQRQAFDCGEAALNAYLKQLASQHGRKNLSRTYVAVTPDAQVIGFYNLSSAQFGFEELPDTLRKARHYPIPAARLGRLAVDREAQGHGVGESLLLNALYRCARTAQEIGIVGVVVDAKHERARDFYLKYEFLPLTGNPLKLVLPITTVIELFTRTGLW